MRKTSVHIDQSRWQIFKLSFMLSVVTEEYALLGDVLQYFNYLFFMHCILIVLSNKMYDIDGTGYYKSLPTHHL